MATVIDSCDDAKQSVEHGSLTDDALNHLWTVVNDLGDTVDRLHEALNFVLSPASTKPPPDPSAPDVDAPAEAPILLTIGRLWRAVQKCNMHMDEIRDRLVL